MSDSKLTSRWEETTPDMATKYLETMNGNRSVRQNKVDFYASQMRAGLWRETHQGIAFSDDGALVDGQHRMWAIVESGRAVKIMVTRGVKAEDVVVLDTGLARSYADVAHYNDWNVDPATASFARVLVLGPGTTRAIPGEIMQSWYQFYREGIDFAVQVRNSTKTAGGKVLPYPMAAVFARAYYGKDVALLSGFAAILKTGVTSFEADRAALTLRDAWLSKRLGDTPTEQYLKTEAAVRAFIERRPIKKLQAAEKELFPIQKLPSNLKYDVIQTSPRTRPQQHKEHPPHAA
jgi:hypothetical protein